MMIKITEKCSMNCTHCMNVATSNGRHMDFSTFANVLAFQKKYGGPICFITGGEPFEHPDFWNFLGYAMHYLEDNLFIIATNGLALQKPANANIVKKLAETQPHIFFQVSTDKRYYSIPIDVSNPVFQLPNVTLITKIPKIYPQGRAATNKLDWEAIGSKCVNIRAVMKQLDNPTLEKAVGVMFMRDKMCTPHIDIYGNIKLGESDLCPVCSNIYKSGEEIVNDILNFQCHKCDFINKNLPDNIKQILGLSI